MTVRDFLASDFGASLDHDRRVGADYAGVAHVTPDEFRRLTGIVADFSRPTKAGYGDDPVSVVYSRNPLSGRYTRGASVSYVGPCPVNGPLGGIHAHREEPIIFVVTR